MKLSSMEVLMICFGRTSLRGGRPSVLHGIRLSLLFDSFSPPQNAERNMWYFIVGGSEKYLCVRSSQTGGLKDGGKEGSFGTDILLYRSSDYCLAVSASIFRACVQVIPDDESEMVVLHLFCHFAAEYDDRVFHPAPVRPHLPGRDL